MTEKNTIICLLEEKGINVENPTSSRIKIYKTNNDTIVCYFTDLGEYSMGYIRKDNGELKPLTLFNDLEKEVINYINEKMENHD
jgi:hypothetical protein